jgi:aquaporin Z
MYTDNNYSLLPNFMLSNWKKYIAEMLGTFSLALVVLVTVALKPSLTPLAAALTLGLVVYLIGTLSGAHINPSVSLGALVIDQLPWKDVVVYVIVQLLGGFVALIVASLFIRSLGTTIGAPDSHSQLAIGFAEALGTFLLGFSVAAVMYKKIPPKLNSLAVGGALFFGIIIASGLGSKGIVNPAVALMTGNATLGYILGPIVGAIAAMWMFKKIMA